MKSKRGFLLAEETLKIIIALVCISFLIYFLSSLYFKSKSNQEFELAEASLNHLIEAINSEAESVEVYNPEGWIISSWPQDTVKSRIIYNTIIENDIPNSCSNLGWQNCLCICDDAANFEGRDCDDAGICMESEFKTDSKIKIENPPIILQINHDELRIITN